MDGRDSARVSCDPVEDDDVVFGEPTVQSSAHVAVATGMGADVGVANVHVVGSRGIRIGDGNLDIVNVSDGRVNLARFRARTSRAQHADAVCDDALGSRRDLDECARRFGDVRVGAETGSVRETTLDELHRRKRSSTGAAVAAAAPPGIVVHRRCFCHGFVGRRRYCVIPKTSASKDFVWKHVEKLERLVGDMKTTGPTPLFREIASVADHLAVNDVVLDGFLGECYLKTNFRRNTCPLEKFYSTCKGLLGDVFGFFKSHESKMGAIVNSVRRDLSVPTSKGLYSTVMYLDRLANCFDGREECVVGICMRTAAVLALRCFDGPLNPAAVMLSPPPDALTVFEMVLRLLYSQSLVPSANVLAYAGLSDNIPLFESVSYELLNQTPECLLNVDVKTICAMLTSGVSVSLSLEDTAEDCEMIMRLLGAHCSLLRRVQRLPVSVRVFSDLWSVKALQMFAFLRKEGRDYDGLTYGLRVPDLFMKRRAQPGSTWSCFLHPDASELTRRSSETFEAMYEDMEAKKVAVVVSTEWATSMIAKCVSLGMSVVFSDRRGPFVVDEEGTGGDACVSPDIACRHVSFGNVRPTIRFSVNLENCVLCTGQDLSRDPDVIVGRNGRCLDLRDLRNMVRDAVVLMNCVLDAEIKKNLWDGGEYLRQYRPLSLGVIGLHTVFSKMGVGYGFVDCLEINRRVFENVYFAAVRASVDLCVRGFPPFPKYGTSIYRAGKFVFDSYTDVKLSLPGTAWSVLRRDMMQYGVRNGQFVALGACENESRIANVSPGFWPREGNLTLEESPLLRSAAPSEISRRVEERRVRLGLPRRPENREALGRMIEPDRIKIAVVNRDLADVPKEKLVEVLRWSGDLEMPVDKATSRVDLSDVSLECYYPSWKVGRQVFLKLCAERAPFVDQCQAIPIVADVADGEDEIIRQLVLAYKTGLAIGVYKCCLRQNKKR
uniref:Ribonucleotide reductase subunit 1 n=1 Tax=Lemniscomys rat herpesvirus TaxID=3141920 RepID=A0AAU7E1T1_9VIRU